MANQPKKYKKFVATAATATLVASAIVPVASAASFSDVVVGGSHSEAINALADQGIIKGYADGTFKPGVQINRGQTVKLLGRWLESQGYEIPADWNSVQRFSDVPVNAADQELVKYAALVKDAGVFNGSQGKLNASQPMQRQHMAVVLVRAIKNVLGEDLVQQYKDAGFVSSIEDLDQAYANENREAIIALEYAGITKVSDGNFRPTQTVTRGQFASFLYRTINLDTLNATVDSIKAINNTTVEVTFKEEVSDVKAADFAIDGLEVKNAAVKQTDAKTVVLTTSSQEGGKTYTVTYKGNKLGQFKGVSAVVPTKVDIVSKSLQGKFGQQVTVQAKVEVPEGQSKAGIPVTFNVNPGANDKINPQLVAEAYTNEEGIATYSYTRYDNATDSVTAYASGDRSKFSVGYVFWGVDTILTVEEVTEGNVINNGANKTYKITYKDPKTGKPVANKTFNVGFLENINVNPDQVKDAQVNGVQALQLSNGSVVRAAQITTDSKGEATFTVSGKNSEVTPVVYDLNTTPNTSNQYYEASLLQASAPKVKFSAVQAEYTIEITRDGGEVAATGYANGRAYKVVVKDKNGNPAANEVVNVAFNEDLDRVIATETNAQFIKLDANDKKVGYNGKQITVKTNSKGEAVFYVGSDKTNDYATPIAWIDINTANANSGTLDEGEPKAVGQITYFQPEYVDGAAVKVYDTSNNKKTSFKGSETAVFKVNLVNQSGEDYTLKSGESIDSVTYTVYNTGANDILVGNQVVSPNRSYTLTNPASSELEVKSVDGKSTSVKVVATGVVKHYVNGTLKSYNFVAKEATATFTATNEISNPYTGILDLNSINTQDKTVKFVGKDAIKYAGESGITYKYFGIGNTTIADADAFIALLEQARAEGKAVVVTYEVSSDNVVTFTIVAERQISTANKTALKASLDAEKAVVEAGNTGYTEESWNAYVTAYNKALAVFNNVYATQAEVDAAKAALDAAKAGLKSAALYTVEFTTADAIAPNEIAKLLKVFESYVVEGTVAEEGVTSIELTFTDVDGNKVTKTVSVVDGKFQATFTLNDFDKHVVSVSYGNNTKNFEEKVK